MQPSTNAFGFSYIEQFHCLADKCEDNCCDNWRVSLHDEQAQNYINNYPALHNIIAKDSEGYRIKKNESGCMAQDSGLCIIHRDYGETLLSDTCANYPRMYRSLNQFYTRSGTMSCPEVARKCLFDENPFALQRTELPDNHKDGAKLHNQVIAQLNPALWQQVISDLVSMVLERQHNIESTLAMLLKLSTQFEQKPVVDWPQAITQIIPVTPVVTEKDATTNAEHCTDLLYTLLEHLERPNDTTEHLRQLVISAFDLHSHDEQNRPRCQLKAEFKHYYLATDPQWLQAALKRFVAAEITRNGFPFISHTGHGQDYGTSIEEWATTLCIRTLTLRLLLTICGTYYLEVQQSSSPDEQSIVTWVYNFCRTTHHSPAAPNELRLRQASLASKGQRLMEYLDINVL